jgi:uncharacterized RDD family membrane protein YckC
MNEVGVGTRVINFLVDTLLIAFIAYGFYKWYMFYVIYWRYTPYQYYLFFHATIFVYYFLWETLLGRTPGKYVTMTRVRSKTGTRPPVYMIFLRSLLRLSLIDAFFIPVLGRPLHDALSNTRVVET